MRLAVLAHRKKWQAASCFLSSAAASWVTGVNLVVDGGYTKASAVLSLMKVRRQQKIKRTTKPQGPNGTPVKAVPKPNFPSDLIPKERYTSRDYMKREWEHMWKKVWLLGCREDDIPEPGDHMVTEIGGESILLTRQQDKSVRAFYNVLSASRKPARSWRATSRKKGPKHSAAAITIGNIASTGGFLTFPIWRHSRKARPPCGGLITLPCDTWGSFVWFSMDPDVEPLLDYLSMIPAHLDPYQFDKMILTEWKTVEWDCNWKASVDAFNESYHVQGIHPQLLYYLDDLDIQIDCYERHNRYLIAFGVLSPRVISPSEIPPPIKVVMRDAGMDPASYEGSVYNNARVKPSRNTSGRTALRRARITLR